MDAITNAADAGGATEFIKKLPKSFETVFPSEYTLYRKKLEFFDISGGQWQRLGLARAFMRMKSADLLLLDEPSASLDPEAEYKMFKSLKEARRERTTVYISHRFNTVRAATRIMVFPRRNEANEGN